MDHDREISGMANLVQNSSGLRPVTDGTLAKTAYGATTPCHGGPS